MGNSRKAELHYEVGQAYTTFDGTSLTQITKAQDITPEDSRSEFPEMDRATIANGVAGGQRTFTLTFTYRYGTGTDAVWTALRAAFTADTTINVAYCDGPLATIGTRVIWFEASVASMPRGFPVEGTVSLPIKLVLAVGANLSHATVSA